MVVNVIKGELNNNLYNKVNIIKVFSDKNDEIVTVNYLNKFLKSKYKRNYQIYDSETIEDENRSLFKAILYNNSVNADEFKGTIEIYEY